MKVYFAKDIHKLIKQNKRDLILGGVKIHDSEYSIEAHSDGDLICHTITSCILAATNNKTIGELYPDTDENNKNKSSLFFLYDALKFLEDKKIAINNIDLTIVCEKILLKNHFEYIKNNLINIIGNNNISIKATRFENDTNMIECYCVLTIND